MKTKIRIREIGLTMALLFFFATIAPAVARAQADEKKEHGTLGYLLTAARAAKNGNPVLTEEARVALKGHVFMLMEDLFEKIESSGIPEDAIKKGACMLPQRYADMLVLMSDIAQTNMSAEEKVIALVGAFDIGCDEITYGAALIFLLSILLGINFGYFGALMYLAAVLCYFGVL